MNEKWDNVVENVNTNANADVNLNVNANVETRNCIIKLEGFLIMI